MARKCYLAAVKGKPKAKELFMVSSEVRTEQNQRKVEPTETISDVKINARGKVARIGSQINE